MQKSKLDEIGVKYNTDKSSNAHNFLIHYEELLANRNIKTIVEVGIWEGASLRTWSEYYPKAEVIGIDIELARLFNEGNIVCYYGDQAKPEAEIFHTVKLCEPDLFIDDGSHFWSHQIKTFETIFPIMKKGSIYIVEDLHTSLIPGWADSLIVPLEYFSKIDSFHIIRNSDLSITGYVIC